MDDIFLWILIILSVLGSIYVSTRWKLHHAGLTAVLILTGLVFAVINGGTVMAYIIIIAFILVVGRILFTVFANHVSNVEIQARNRFFQTVGLSEMISNCHETSPFGIPNSGNAMMKAYTDGTTTVTFMWDDMVRAAANRGKEPSFTEPLVAVVNGPKGQRMYMVENLGIPSLMTIEIMDKD